jgi:hypothetical protein
LIVLKMEIGVLAGVFEMMTRLPTAPPGGSCRAVNYRSVRESGS